MKTFSALYRRGSAFYYAERLDDAQADLERAVEGLRAARGPNHNMTLAAMEPLAGVHLARKQHDRALELMQAVLEGRAAVLGNDHPQVARGHANLGIVLFNLGRFEQAIARFEQALALYDRTASGVDLPVRAEVLIGMSKALRGLRRDAEAVAPAEKALAIARDHHPPVLAKAEMTLARALWAAGRDRARAIQLARSARDRWREKGAPDVANAEAWLAERGVR
jgi:tetratricopeptide (TPR) repeat protein